LPLLHGKNPSRPNTQPFYLKKRLNFVFTKLNLYFMKNLKLLSLLLLLSCHKTIGSDIIDTSISLLVENSAGENAFYPANPNGVDPDALKLFYQENGNIIEVYNANLDCPKNICYVSEQGLSYINIFPNDTKRENEPLTFLQWPNGDMDTLKCHFIRKNDDAYLVCDSVWFNGTRMFPDDAIPALGRAFKVIK
jgi:hypothetical protein